MAAKQGLSTILRAMQSGPRSVSAVGRVVAYQGWSLRGVPLYSYYIYTVSDVLNDILAEPLNL